MDAIKTAVLLITYKRLDTTKLVFESIRKAKPPRLYISSNIGKDEEESKKVKIVRDYLEKNIDWPCEVHKLFRTEHLSAKLSISGAIDWFFENEEMGIILEDDCLPDISFFGFCEELLERYKYDMRVWHIGGVSTINEDILMNQDSYYFSKYNHIWGWASWANRWKFYDANISLLDEFTKGDYIRNISEQKMLQKFWINNFRCVKHGENDTWDYQWYFTTWVNSGISIIPTINLVTNIGFGANATHPTNTSHKLSNMEVHEISSGLIHPKIIMPNKVYDEFNEKFLFGLNYFNYNMMMLKKILKKILKIK